MSFQQSDDADSEGGQGDRLSCSRSCRSSDESTGSNKSRVRSADSSGGRSQASYSQNDFEDDKETSSVFEKSPVSPVKKSPKKTKGYYKGQKRSGVQHPLAKKNLRPARKAPLLPPIKPLDGVVQHIASAHEHRIKELNNQVRELQHQLNGAWQENRLLRRVQNRHTVALQQFQDSQSGLPQILQKHGNEVHALQELLRRVRAQRNALARRLTSMEDHQQQTCEELRRLQLLCRQRHLGEREELTQQLSKLTLDLDIKNKRIKDLERNLVLSNAFFSRHADLEMRKTVEAQDLSKVLQEQIDRLSQKIKERERELEIRNIYSLRFPKANKGTKETKSIQTEDLWPLPLEAPASKLELEYESEEHLVKELDKQRNTRNRELCATDFSEIEKAEDNTAKSVTEDTESEGGADTAAASEGRETNNNEEQQRVDGDDEDDEDGNGETYNASALPWDAASDLISPREVETSLDLDDLQAASQQSANKQTMPRIRRHYTFKETVQNLHRGRPAYGPLAHGPQKGSRGLARAPSLDGDSCAYGQGEDPRQGRDPRSRKRSLMRELFSQTDAAEPCADHEAHAKQPPATSSDSDRTSAYVLGDTVSQIRDRFIIFD